MAAFLSLIFGLPTIPADLPMTDGWYLRQQIYAQYCLNMPPAYCAPLMRIVGDWEASGPTATCPRGTHLHDPQNGNNYYFAEKGTVGTGRDLRHLPWEPLGLKDGEHVGTRDGLCHRNKWDELLPRDRSR